MLDVRDKLLKLFENLFNPINNKDYGLYWLVANEKSEPLANAEELLKYIEEKVPEGSFINRYANLDNDLILENDIFLDFDLSNKEYLKQEEGNTTKVLKELATNLNSDFKNYDSLTGVLAKYNDSYSIENGFIEGYNSFIDSIYLTEAEALTKLVKEKEKEEIAKLKSIEEIQKYFLDKFEHGYLKEPFKEVITVAKYFNHIGVKTVLNASGSKGFALRIPITTIDFKGTEIEDNPENVKLFLVALAELIETKLLEKSFKSSCMDYSIFCKGMQRIPTSQHNKTKLYANFIEPSFNYIEAIDVLEKEVPSYIPDVVDLEENTKTFIESDIYKEAIKKAVEDTNIKPYNHETGNIAYKCNSEENKELKEMILEIYPDSLNYFPYKVMHLLKRSGFSKEEVEAIFHDVEPDIRKYNKNFKRNIKYTFDNPNAKISGLKNLIDWIKKNYPNHEKDYVIKFFKDNFNYYEVPEETTLEDVLIIQEKEYNLTKVATSKQKYYILKNFESENKNIVINKEKAVVQFKDNNKPIAKLTLKTSDKKAVEGLVPSSKDNLTKFIKAVERKTGINKEAVEEAITELDLYLGYIEEEEEQEEEIKKQEEEITEDLEENKERIEFKDYIQLNKSFETKGIYHKQPTKKGSFKVVLIANAVINDIEIVLNPLKLNKEDEKKLKPVYNVSYYNKTIKKEKTVKYLSDKELTEEFVKAKVFYNSTKEYVESVLNAFIIEGANKNRIKVKEEAYLEGFYVIDGKVIENTKLKNLKKYTSEDVAEAINLLNEIMKDRSKEGKANDSTVYRFYLWNPFSYCLKQIGYKTGLYSLILIGKSKANKTGAIKIGNLFYLNDEEETSGSTVSVLGSQLEVNSFAKAFDECFNLLNQPETDDVMKKAIQEKTTRITKDRTDNKKTDKFNAFALPVFLLNERKEFKDYIRERYKITDYTSKSYISKEERDSFNKKYLPETEDTILKKVAIIGNEFKNKIIPLIEAKDKRLFNPEELTIDILKEIAEETSEATGTKVDFLPEMYTITEASEKYNYDVNKEIVNLLNTEFKKKNKVIGNNYSSNDFVKSAINNDFDFITYNKNRTPDNKEDVYLIAYSKFEKYVNNNVEETVELESILEALDLTEKLEAKRECYNNKNKKTYETLSEFIRKQNFIKIEGSSKDKNIKGFYLTTEELINNLFGFNIDFSKTEEPVELKVETVTDKT